MEGNRPRAASGRRETPRIATVTLDGSLLSVTQGGAGRWQGEQLRPVRSAGTRSDRMLLDTGESEDSYLQTLRTHFVRKSTAETAFPMHKPSRKYTSPTPTASGQAKASMAGVSPVLAKRFSNASAHCAVSSIASSSGKATEPLALNSPLQQQELTIWQQREQELLDAQETRLAQLEDALLARQDKREAYVIHRLEAAAADKVAVLARQREQLAKQKAELAELAKHAKIEPGKRSQPASPKLPLLARVQKPIPPASPTLAAAVQEARNNLSSISHISNLESGLQSKLAFGSGTHLPAVQQPLASEKALERRAWVDRKMEVYNKQLSSVFSNIQAIKATTGHVTHPLEPLHMKRQASMRIGAQAQACNHMPSCEADSLGAGTSTNNSSTDIRPIVSFGVAEPLPACSSASGIQDGKTSAARPQVELPEEDRKSEPSCNEADEVPQIMLASRSGSSQPHQHEAILAGELAVTEQELFGGDETSRPAAGTAAVHVCQNASATGAADSCPAAANHTGAAGIASCDTAASAIEAVEGETSSGAALYPDEEPDTRGNGLESLESTVLEDELQAHLQSLAQHGLATLQAEALAALSGAVGQVTDGSEDNECTTMPVT